MSSRPAPAGPATVPIGSYGRPSAVIPLAPILDAVRGMRTTFRSGDTVVHVFGGRSQNKKNWFVGFAAEGVEEDWINGRKMLHWALVSRTGHFEIAGRRYSTYLKGKITDRMESRIVVEPEDKSEKASSWSLQDLVDAAYDVGVPVMLGGREYRLHYTREFEEDEKGEFKGYSKDRSITLVTRSGEKMAGYQWLEADIPTDAILVSDQKPLGGEEAGIAPLALGLRRDASGSLEIYLTDSAVPAD